MNKEQLKQNALDKIKSVTRRNDDKINERLRKVKQPNR